MSATEPLGLFDARGEETSSADRDVVLSAGPRCDLFVEPGTGRRKASASVLTRRVDDRAFQFSARVRPDLRATFDAGALLVRCDADHWAKVCLEQATSGVPTAVSVVTRHVSDDANGWVLPGSDAYLRISRKDEVFAFHVSADGKSWDLLRVFSLPAPGAVEVGLLAQAPVGDGCTVTFSDVAYVPEPLEDPRSGA
jgi:regulation of enolase protein 1 (concanavalin A-like superfamily)